MNYAGKVKARPSKVVHGAISQVVPQVQQIFHRIAAEDAVAAESARFDYFVNKVGSLRPVPGRGRGRREWQPTAAYRRSCPR